MKKIFCLFLIMCFISGCSSEDSLKGKWKASIENQKVYNFSDGTSRGGVEEYILECDGKGHYDLYSKSGNLANSYYKISKKSVTFFDEGRKVLAICKINNDELDCSEKSYYSTKYVRY